MKKVLFSLAAILLCSYFAHAQFSGTVTGQVVDAQQQPIPGVAVFHFGFSSEYSKFSWQITPADIEPEPYHRHDYTNGNGDYSMSYYKGNGVQDTLIVGVYDCQGNLTIGYMDVSINSTNPNIDVQIPCAPGACDALTTVDTTLLNNRAFFFAIALRDSASVLTGAAGAPVIHNWSITGVTSNIKNVYYDGPNEDTVSYRLSSLPKNFEYCYQRTANCTPVCDTVGVLAPPPAPFCQSDFYVDTVNSINFNGQIVMWENSTTSRGNIIDWYWIFGDGGFSNQQYPTYTYSDTNVYEICLKITAVDGGDTCVSTYCDSVGFDSNGNLHKSTGFTVKVMDPATIGQLEEELVNHFSLYPNPSNGTASLSWSGAVHVNEVQVISMSGQVLKSVKPQAGLVKLETLESGAYILRISSDEGVASLKMIVE